MNTILICVLATGLNDNFGGNNPNPQSAQWDNFLSWLKPKVGALIQIQTANPVAVPTNISVNLFMFSTGNSDTVTTDVTNNINSLFSKNMYSLGKSIYLSDIWQACKTSDVDYLDIVTPTSDVNMSSVYNYATLGTLTINTYYSS